MSVNFRTRIKTPIAGDGTTIMGACCYPDGDGPVSESYYTCLNNNGYFQIIPDGQDIEDITCPDLGAVGCCCSCSYVDNFDDYLEDPEQYDGGVMNATFCECNTLGGVWKPPNGGGEEQHCDSILEADAVFQFCTGGTNQIDNDVRIPQACCHDGECDNVCSPQQCLDLIEDDPEGTLISFAVCDDDGDGVGSHPPADCVDPANRRMGERDRRTNIIVVDKIPTRKDRVEIYSGKINQEKNKSCCIYKEKNEVKCTQLTKSQCSIKDGVWGGFDSGGDSVDCDSGIAEQFKNILKNDGSIDSSYVESWEMGQEIFDGGRFVGVFYSSSEFFGSGSICLGNRNTGIAQDYISESTMNSDINFNKTKYAVIINKEDTHSVFDFGSSIHNENIKRSSFCDTLRNRRLFSSTRLQRLVSINDYNIIKWSVPSMDVLSFIQKNTITAEFKKNSKINTNPRSKFSPMKEAYYWSSTPYGTIGDSVHFYTQLFRKQITSNRNSFVKVTPSTSKLPTRSVWLIPIIG